jgi:hypothetical protein
MRLTFCETLCSGDGDSREYSGSPLLQWFDVVFVYILVFAYVNSISFEHSMSIYSILNRNPTLFIA